jgi:uncharacterized membrane protein YgaE (UPF0421/DUF939 family)
MAAIFAETAPTGRRLTIRRVTPSTAGWSASAREVLRLRVHELRAAGVPILQAAAAAGIAWAIAHGLLDHPRPFFAPIAALIVLGLAPGLRSRRALEMVIGVALGIAVGDLLIAAIGSGAAQIALVALLAMAAAVLLGGGPLVVSQAATSGVLVAALPSSQAIPTRFVDALVGGTVGLAVFAAVPRNPLRTVQRATHPLFVELREVLEGIAAALAAGDRAAAERLLVRARATSDQSGRLRQAVEQARETVRLAPTYWRSRDDVARYAEAAPHVDLAVRNVRVLARAALSAVETSATVSPGVPDALRDLATGAERLEHELEHGRGASEAIEAALAAAARATLALEGNTSIPVTVIVGQVRSTAVDLLRALGIDRSEAVGHVRAAARMSAEDVDGARDDKREDRE